MMARLRGVVRYRFKDEDGDLNVVIEGDADWVESKVQQLGLSDVGFTMPIGTATFASNLSDVSKEKAKKNSRKVELEPLGDKPQDMGPTPDPSSIPVVRRPIGELNIEEAIAQAGLTRPERPDPIDLMDMLEEADEPRPVQSSISVDPMGGGLAKIADGNSCSRVWLHGFSHRGDRGSRRGKNGQQIKTRIRCLVGFFIQAR